MRETEQEEVWMGRRRPRSSSGVLAEEAKGGDDKAVMGESREHWSVGRSEYGRGKSRKDDEMRTSQSVEEQVQRCHSETLSQNQPYCIDVSRRTFVPPERRGLE